MGVDMLSKLKGMDGQKIVNIGFDMGNTLLKKKADRNANKSAMWSNLWQWYESQQRADLQRRALDAQEKIDIRKRKNLLAEELASQRARLGAGGVGARSRSAQTVLKRLQDHSDEEVSGLKTLNQFKRQGVDLDRAMSTQRNLLQYHDLKKERSLAKDKFALDMARHTSDLLFEIF